MVKTFTQSCVDHIGHSGHGGRGGFHGSTCPFTVDQEIEHLSRKLST